MKITQPLAHRKNNDMETSKANPAIDVRVQKNNKLNSIHKFFNKIKNICNTYSSPAFLSHTKNKSTTIFCVGGGEHTPTKINRPLPKVPPKKFEESKNIYASIDDVKEIKLSQIDDNITINFTPKTTIKLGSKQYSEIFGKKIGSGATCNVYLSKIDSSLVLKSFNDGEYKDKIHAAKNELSAFVKYYGEDSAKIITNGSDVSLQLVKIPGESLSEINDKKLPSNAIELFFDMIARMNDAGLYHDDLSTNNIFYDDNSKQFYPIDFSTSLDSFFELSDGAKRYFNTADNRKLNNIIHYIKNNQD